MYIALTSAQINNRLS